MAIETEDRVRSRLDDEASGAPESVPPESNDADPWSEVTVVAVPQTGRFESLTPPPARLEPRRGLPHRLLFG
jgi:hypothetical protein